MTLKEIKQSRKIHDVIWTYNLCAAAVDRNTWDKAEKTLGNLVDRLMFQEEAMTEQKVKELFRQTVLELEGLFKASPLDEMGVYEYGGLNDFFADIVEALDFQVKRGRHYLISNFVYGVDFEEK